MRPNRGGKQVPPGDGPYRAEYVEVIGPPDYHMPMPPTKSRGPLTPAGNGEELPHRPGPGEFIRKRIEARRAKLPLVPTADEVATLPRLAREAFETRCAARVPGFVPNGKPVTAEVAGLLFARATLVTPLTRQLRCIRRDFDRLRRLAREHNWTDDTLVPPEALGPLWPPGVAPHAAE